MVFALTISFLVFYFVRPQDFSGGAIQGEKVVLLVLGAALSIWAVKMVINKKPLIRDAKDIFVLGLYAAIVISTLSMKWVFYTMDTLIQFGKVVLIYFLISDILDSPQKFKVFLWAMVSCVFIVAIIGILQYYDMDFITGVKPFIIEELTEEGRLVKIKRIRGVGLFDTNQLAYLMGFTTPFVYGLFRLTRTPLLKIFLLIFVAAYGAAVYFTLSRGGMLAFAIAILCLYLFRKGAGGKLLVFIGVGFLALFLLTTPTRIGKLTGVKSDESAQGRLEVWHAGSQAWKASPVVGVGVNTYVDRFKRAAHNAVVQVIVETGIVGIFFWFGIFYFTVRALIMMMSQYSQTEYAWVSVLSLSFLASLFQFFVSCSFSNSAAYNFYTFMYVGMVTALQRYPLRQAVSSGEKVQATGVSIGQGDILNISFSIIGIIILWKAVLIVFMR